MIQSLSFARRNRGQARLARLGRLGRRPARIAWRAVLESLYLLTAPVIAFAGLFMVLGGLCAGTVISLGAGRARSSLAAWLLAPARWFADLERWRIATLRSASTRTRPGTRPGTRGSTRARTRAEPRTSPADPELWLDVTHAVVVLPLALVTATITYAWWFVGIGGSTAVLRDEFAPGGKLRPVTLYLGSAHTHLALSLGLTSVTGRLAFGTVVGLAVLATLPLATRACVAIQAGLGQALLSDASALHRRIRGLEQERDTARAQTAAAVSAEATALRRLERDLHDGPQQRLVRLALELGRAQHNLDRRPEAVREALADAVVQAHEALDELRALSRGIAPPILVDRGLAEALTSLAARSTVPVQVEVAALDRRLDPAIETAAYFVVSEAMTNVAKHSYAGRCEIGLRHDDGTLRAWVTDDGVGGAALEKGHGLQGLDDRLRAVGGQLQVTSPDGGPTTITAEVPCR